jgi:peptidoglycan/xylan/chitin deacetylase (PgdA/CDA1 family)
MMFPDRISVLMYHAVEKRGVDTDADSHYSVTPEVFDEQIDALLADGFELVSVAALIAAKASGSHACERLNGQKIIAVTFDDGHLSNGDAAQSLADRQASADFFVNPADVGSRHRLSWSALADMARIGMSIQSHGFTHEHLDAMSPDGVWNSLTRSRSTIEDRLGLPVTLFAPPGGRMPPRLQATARKAGYTQVCSSRPGAWQTAASEDDIPRFAVLESTQLALIRRWAAHHRVDLALASARYQALRTLKSIMGPASYERLRLTLIGKGD